MDVFAKTYFSVHVSVGTLDFLYVSWTKNLYLVEPLVIETRTWNSHFVIWKYLDYMQYYMVLLEQCRHKVAKVHAIVTWLGEDQFLACLVMWLVYYFVFT